MGTAGAPDGHPAHRLSGGRGQARAADSSSSPRCWPIRPHSCLSMAFTSGCWPTTWPKQRISWSGTIQAGPPRSAVPTCCRCRPQLCGTRPSRATTVGPMKKTRSSMPTRELVADAAESIRRQEQKASSQDAASDAASPPAPKPVRILGYASNGVSDEIVLGMLARAVDDFPLSIEIVSTRMLASEVIELARSEDFAGRSASRICHLVSRRKHAISPSGYAWRSRTCPSSSVAWPQPS